MLLSLWMLDTGREARPQSHKGDVWLVLRRHGDDDEGGREGREEGQRRQGPHREFQNNNRKSLDRTLGVVRGVLRSAVRLADHVDHVLLLLRAPAGPQEATSRSGRGGTRERARRAAHDGATDQAAAAAVATLVTECRVDLRGDHAPSGSFELHRDFYSADSTSGVLSVALAASVYVYCRIRKLSELTKLFHGARLLKGERLRTECHVIGCGAQAERRRSAGGAVRAAGQTGQTGVSLLHF